jgi:hypothetical protein
MDCLVDCKKVDEITIIICAGSAGAGCGTRDVRTCMLDSPRIGGKSCS